MGPRGTRGYRGFACLPACVFVVFVREEREDRKEKDTVKQCMSQRQLYIVPNTAAEMVFDGRNKFVERIYYIYICIIYNNLEVQLIAV